MSIWNNSSTNSKKNVSWGLVNFGFGDASHPELKGVASYGENPVDVHIIMEVDEPDNIIFKNNKIANCNNLQKEKKNIWNSKFF